MPDTAPENVTAPPGAAPRHLPDPPGEPGAPHREFTLRSAFALAFSDVSPIAGLYGVFALGIATAGPAFWWAFPVVLAGQLLVAAVFGELVSRWPLQGSVYQWARHLVGPRFGWFTNWAYMWGLTIAMSALAYAASGFLAEAVGLTGLSGTGQALVALGVLLFGTAANMVGRGVLRVLLVVSMAAELASTFGLGTVLLFFHHVNPLSSLLTTAGSGSWQIGPLLAVAAFVGWSFIGFESAGSIAEEVRESRRVLPKAMPLALLAVGLLIMYASLGVLLAIPSIPDVLSGKVADPISGTLHAQLGAPMSRILLVALAVGFTASLMAVQAAVSRAVWAGARDRILPGARLLGALSKGEALPRNAIGLTAVVAGALLFVSASKIYALLLSFSSAGFYLSYALPVCAAAWVRLRGRWQPGEVSLGRWGAPVTYAAAVWIVLETVNVAWPRTVNGTWYVDWGVLIMTGVLGVLGALLCRRMFRPHRPAAAAPVLAVVDAVEGEGA